jgi:hypothetical protein
MTITAGKKNKFSNVKINGNNLLPSIDMKDTGGTEIEKKIGALRKEEIHLHTEKNHGLIPLHLLWIQMMKDGGRYINNILLPNLQPKRGENEIEEGELQKALLHQSTELVAVISEPTQQDSRKPRIRVFEKVSRLLVEDCDWKYMQTVEKKKEKSKGIRAQGYFLNEVCFNLLFPIFEKNKPKKKKKKWKTEPRACRRCDSTSRSSSPFRICTKQIKTDSVLRKL